jgi:hypothetical protein
VPTIEQSYEDSPYDLVRAAGKPLNAYEQHFAENILDMAKEKHTSIAFLHIPIDSEQGLHYMPERGRWVESLHTNAPMIGVASAVLFNDVDMATFHNYYRDQHFNINGSMLFTRSMLPAILEAYDERDKHE